MLVNTSRPIPLLEKKWLPSSRQAKLACRGKAERRRKTEFAVSLDQAQGQITALNFFISLMIETMEVTQNAVRNEERKIEKDRKKRRKVDDLEISFSHLSHLRPGLLIIFRVDKRRISKQRLALSGLQCAYQREHTKIITLSFAIPITAISRSPSLGACNYPVFLSRRFYRPIYF